MRRLKDLHEGVLSLLNCFVELVPCGVFLLEALVYFKESDLQKLHLFFDVALFLLLSVDLDLDFVSVLFDVFKHFD